MMSRSTRGSAAPPHKLSRRLTRKELNYYVASMLRELAQLARDGGRETLAQHIEVAAREAENDDVHDGMN
jgi:propanediol dehydratase small subunit